MQLAIIQNVTAIKFLQVTKGEQKPRFRGVRTARRGGGAKIEKKVCTNQNFLLPLWETTASEEPLVKPFG